MKKAEIIDRISRGRTDLVVDLMDRKDWREILTTGPVTPVQWFVYYNDTTALRLVKSAAGELIGLDLDHELGNAAFFGHWKVVDFLIRNGANVNYSLSDSGETPLHGALSKTGKPYFIYTVKLLVENGADVNAKTKPGAETEAFMRDVRTKGETPLHRAAAYSSYDTIEYLLDHGADRTARDANGDSPLTWASYHLRSREILNLLAFPPFSVRVRSPPAIVDNECSWGGGMDWDFLGDYLPENTDE